MEVSEMQTEIKESDPTSHAIYLAGMLQTIRPLGLKLAEQSQQIQGIAQEGAGAALTLASTAAVLEALVQRLAFEAGRAAEGGRTALAIELSDAAVRAAGGVCRALEALRLARQGGRQGRRPKIDYSEFFGD